MSLVALDSCLDPADTGLPENFCASNNLHMASLSLGSTCTAVKATAI